MSILDEDQALADGTPIPRLGLGTWLMDAAVAAGAVRTAIGLGYRNIDTAQAYGNESGVGEGVRSSGVDREQLFVSTKLAAEIKDHDEAAAAIAESLARLDVGYIDLMLIHAPQPWADFRGGDYAEGNLQAWRALEEAQRSGRVRAIGVSNFLEDDLATILDHAEAAPQVNQILVHAGNTPAGLIDHCREHDVVVEAYSPIGHGEILANPTLVSMAGRYGVGVAQLCIRYTLRLGCVSLPKTANPGHMRANADVDFQIGDADMDVLRGLDERDYGASAVFPVYSGK